MPQTEELATSQNGSASRRVTDYQSGRAPDYVFGIGGAYCVQFLVRVREPNGCLLGQQSWFTFLLLHSARGGETLIAFEKSRVNRKLATSVVRQQVVGP